MKQEQKGDYCRQLVYFSSYRDREKGNRAGYAAIFIRNELCEIQIYYRGRKKDAEGKVQPVYVFCDGSAVEGEEIAIKEGMATCGFETATENFLRTGRNIHALEAIYLEGTGEGVCGGRTDGQALFGEDTYSVTKWMDTVTEIVTEREEELRQDACKLQETWNLNECMERLPELKLPFDGIRRRSCRMTLADMEHLPKEWKVLKENHFLLHGYYEYHHLLFGKLCGRHGERFVIGVPGEYGPREQYMAECFGFSDFAPLEQGKKHRGSFGYWYYYLTREAY